MGRAGALPYIMNKRNVTNPLGPLRPLSVARLLPVALSPRLLLQGKSLIYGHARSGPLVTRTAGYPLESWLDYR